MEFILTTQERVCIPRDDSGQEFDWLGGGCGLAELDMEPVTDDDGDEIDDIRCLTPEADQTAREVSLLWDCQAVADDHPDYLTANGNFAESAWVAFCAGTIAEFAAALRDQADLEKETAKMKPFTRRQKAIIGASITLATSFRKHIEIIKDGFGLRCRHCGMEFRTLHRAKLMRHLWDMHDVCESEPLPDKHLEHRRLKEMYGI